MKSSKRPGNTPPTYCDDDSSLLKKSNERDVKFVEPVKKFFTTSIKIVVGGTGFPPLEPESNWKYSDDGINSILLLIAFKLPPLNVFDSSTTTGM